MKSRYCVPVIVLCLSFPLLSMWKQVSGQIEEKTLCKVHFESTASFLCDKPGNKNLSIYLGLCKPKPFTLSHEGSCNENCYKNPDHPFISAEEKPYTSGNGGLVNPKLLNYTCVAKPIEGGVQVAVKGIVETEGIAPIALNATTYGQSYNYDPNIRDAYETSLLEDIILGALKERSVDRGFSGNEFLQKYIEIIKAEWTSHLSDDDDGNRSSEQNDMIKRYFPQKVYWRSVCYNSDKFRRIGREISDRLPNWNGEDDGANFKVILDTFKIDVERVGVKEVCVFEQLLKFFVKKSKQDAEK